MGRKHTQRLRFEANKLDGGLILAPETEAVFRLARKMRFKAAEIDELEDKFGSYEPETLTLELAARLRHVADFLAADDPSDPLTPEQTANVLTQAGYWLSDISNDLTATIRAIRKGARP